ncbi:MAG TPA: ankyrin repeat domain-containing protein, partial [Thermoanaerobaculia bacterium]
MRMKHFLLIVGLLLSPAVVKAEPAVSPDENLAQFTAAAMEGKVAEAKELLAKPGFLHAADRDGHTALFGAACAGNLEILDAVLAQSPDVNRRDRKGATALFYAASGGKIP